jgi:hypothetical protein
MLEFLPLRSYPGPNEQRVKQEPLP